MYVIINWHHFNLVTAMKFTKPPNLNDCQILWLCGMCSTDKILQRTTTCLCTYMHKHCTHKNDETAIVLKKDNLIM